MRRREFITLFGGGAAWPLVARAQLAQRRRVGVLMSTARTDADEAANVSAFVGALSKAGWSAERNLTIDYRWGDGDPRLFQKYAQELVDLKPDVLFVKGAAVPAIVTATAAIPVVFAVLSDEVAQRYVSDFARPNGNLTGFTSNKIALVGKRIEILKEIAIKMTRVLYLRGARPETLPLFQRAEESASALGLRATDGASSNLSDLERTVAGFSREENGGIMSAFDAFNVVHRDQIIELARQYRLPAIFHARSFVAAGGLASYGFNTSEQYAQAAVYVDRILRGEKPSGLPVQEPTRFELVVNLKTAKELRLSVAPSILAVADEVIE